MFFNQKVFIFFLFLNENICYGHSLELPLQGDSNEYSQHMFLWRNKKNEPAHEKINKMACAPSKDSDQPGHPPNLISLHCALNG